MLISLRENSKGNYVRRNERRESVSINEFSNRLPNMQLYTRSRRVSDVAAHGDTGVFVSTDHDAALREKILTFLDNAGRRECPKRSGLNWVVEHYALSVTAGCSRESARVHRSRSNRYIINGTRHPLNTAPNSMASRFCSSYGKYSRRNICAVHLDLS